MLNFHHLRYFHAVARDGNLTRAAADLGKTPQTLSHQIRALEEELGVGLFDRRGRRLVLTPAGAQVLTYAEEIFSLGQELVDSVEAHSGDRPIRLRVGVADVLPKRIAYALVNPALELAKEVRPTFREAAPERLLGDLAVRELDMVLTDAPIPPSVSVRAHSHLLGESGVSLMATPELARTVRSRFPHSVSGTPLLVPTERAALRRELDRWLGANDLHPQLAGEFDDFALMGTFAKAGRGALAVPSVIAGEVGLELGLEEISLLEGVQGRFFAITLDRDGENEAIAAILAQEPSAFFTT